MALQDEIRRSAESRYDHRLYGVLLVAQGMTCLEVARLLGDALGTVEYWVHRFEEKGLAGLVEGTRPGKKRPRRLNNDQLKEKRKGKMARRYSPRLKFQVVMEVVPQDRNPA